MGGRTMGERTMGKSRNVLRWIAVLTAVVVLAAACGDDGGDDAAPSDSSSDTTPADTTPSDTTPADTTPSDTTPADTTPSDTTDPGTTPTAVDCAEVQAAVEAASDFTALDPTGGSTPSDLEASFNQSRASLAALGEAAPEISGEVEQALEGLDALGAIFAELDWNTDFTTNPQAGLQLATALGNADVMGLVGAMTAISAWITTSCTS